jgi:hypothetical protein
MVLTSMGVFGFLSKAHLDQAVPAGDISAQVQIFDDKIQTQQDNIKTARAALTQMDSQVDQVLGRSSDERGAERAVQIRRNQARERTALQNDIAKAQKEITTLQEQRAPVASQARVLAAEVGPIKYIAALVYGDNPEANVLEKAVRWVIILIVVVFDPLAITLLLAATKTFEWERANKLASARKEPDYEADDGPLTQDQINQLRNMAKADLSTGKVIAKETLFPEAQEFFDRARQTAQDIDAGTYEPPDVEPVKKQSVLAGLDKMWSRAKKLVIKDSESEHAPLQHLDAFESTVSPAEKEARRRWKDQNPTDTIHRQQQMYSEGKIDSLPWHKLELQADNELSGHQGEVKGFGTVFPSLASKGDMFLRVDQLPTILYKFNGSQWIEIDKNLSEQHAWDDAYIDHLIEKIGTGEYDPDLLSDAERDSIEYRLNTKQN